MTIAELMAIVRGDYLDDEASGYLWSDAFLLRAFAEAERQACNRSDLIFDDSTTVMQIVLKDATASYPLSSKITRINRVGIGSKVAEKKSRYSLDALDSTWRDRTGMLNNTVYYVVSGRTIRFSPAPSVALGDTLVTVAMEGYRLPLETTIDETYEPEIPEEFHHDLIYWVLHEAYKKQDSDSFNQEKSDYFLARFNATFGTPISAAKRKNIMEEESTSVIAPYRYIRSRTQLTDPDWYD